jgi:hypothetical protein
LIVLGACWPESDAVRAEKMARADWKNCLIVGRVSESLRGRKVSFVCEGEESQKYKGLLSVRLSKKEKKDI